MWLLSPAALQLFVLQAGVIPFRQNSGDMQLCVSFKPRSGTWKVPKGCVEFGDSPSQTALNEALEEAGLHGHLIGGPIGTYSYKKRGSIYQVVMYLMQVTTQDDYWKKKSSRERHWLSPQTALLYLSEHPASPLLEQALGTLTKGNIDLKAVVPDSRLG